MFACAGCDLPLFRLGDQIRKQHRLAELPTSRWTNWRSSSASTRTTYLRAMLRGEVHCRRCGAPSRPRVRRRPGSSTRPALLPWTALALQGVSSSRGCVGDLTAESATLFLTRFLHANRYPPPDQVRGHASLENAMLNPAIFASPAIVPRSSDRGIFIQAIEMMRFSFLAWGLRGLHSRRWLWHGLAAWPPQIEYWRQRYGYLRCAEYRGCRPAVIANPTPLQNISGNIANASTIGFRSVGTTFEDLVAQSHRHRPRRSRAVCRHFRSRR